MGCFHPLKRFDLGLDFRGKSIGKITSYDCDFVLLDLGSRTVTCHRGDPFYLDGHKTFTDFSEIGCGHCLGCRLRENREWANRLALESICHEYTYFITLTYDDDHLRRSYYTLDDDGLAGEVFTLRKVDHQNFMKDFRTVFGSGVRFYMCGEYGSKTFRPHYHYIMFMDRPIPDLLLYKRSPAGDLYYNSALVSKCWTYGYSVIAAANWATMCYTASYVRKKLGKSDDIKSKYLSKGLEPEFALMSRRPGIARPYYDIHPEIKDYDEISISMAREGRKFMIPRYFEYLEGLDGVDLTSKKEKRKLFMENRREFILSQTDLDYLSYLEVTERNLEDKISLRKRGDTL